MATRCDCTPPIATLSHRNSQINRAAQRFARCIASNEISCVGFKTSRASRATRACRPQLNLGGMSRIPHCNYVPLNSCAQLSRSFQYLAALHNYKTGRPAPSEGKGFILAFIAQVAPLFVGAEFAHQNAGSDKGRGKIRCLGPCRYSQIAPSGSRLPRSTAQAGGECICSTNRIRPNQLQTRNASLVRKQP